MTTDEKENKSKIAETEQVDNREKERNKTRPASRLGIFICLTFSITAVGFAAYNFLSINELKSDSSLTEKIDQFETSSQALNSTITTIQSQQIELERELADLAESQERTGQSLQTLFDTQNNDEIGWSVSEVEYLINIANLRITLEQDIDTALVALQTADNRLALLGDPNLFIVRRQLTAEMNALKSVETVDITGLSLYLTDLVSRVKMLPLKPAAIPENSNSTSLYEQTSPSWEKILIDVSNSSGITSFAPIDDNVSISFTYLVLAIK